MYRRKYLIISVLISIFLHMLLFVGSMHITMHGFKIKEKRRTRFFRIKTIKKEIPRQTVSHREIIVSKPLKFENPSHVDEGSRELIKEEKKIKKEELIKPEENVVQPLEKVLMVDNETITPDETSNESAVMNAALYVMRRDLIDDSDIPEDVVLVSPEDFMTRGQVPKNFYEKMPGFTPSIRKSQTAGLSVKKGGRHNEMSFKYTPAIKTKKRASPLDSALVFELSKYIDPRDGFEYLRIDIKVAENDKTLKPLPKEILFLMDCSFSIAEKRLEQFKEGLKYCMTNLNPEDTFNIIAFKTRLIKFWPFPIKNTQEITWQALQFIDDLTVGNKTDTYKALHESIQNETKNHSPAYIILLSDGKPSVGVTDSRKIISNITKLNQGRISIFSFTGGVFINRYLLDFIAYNNRGWTEYAKRTRLIAKQLSGMYDKIKDPILTNVRFHVSGLDDVNIFPKLLPDFFRNATFTIYGRCIDEKEFTLEVLADAQDGTHAYLVNGDLSEAVEGDSSIARNWAFNKIYYLISLLDGEQNAKPIIEEIQTLYKKFNIRTPYLKRLKK